MSWSSRWAGRSVAVLVALVLAAAFLVPGTARAVTAPAEPSGVAAKGAILIDGVTGKTRWSRSADVQRPVASITKTMTALVVLRKNKLNKVITVKQKWIDYAIRHDGSLAGLRAGDKLTVKQLLYAMMLPSGCDAAFALADTFGPGWPGFVKQMNATAKKLGMTRTKFDNFDGLPWTASYKNKSTPRDLMKMTRAVMKQAQFRTIIATKTYKLPKTKTRHAYTFTNTNRLLGVYGGVNGVKTGTTKAAGYCLLFAAKRGSRTLYGVVLNSSTTNEQARFTDTTKILDWGFGVKKASILTIPPIPPGANVG